MTHLQLRPRVLGLCLRKKLFHEDIRGVFGFQSSSWPAHYKITQIAREEVSSEVRLMQALLPTTMSKHLGVGFASQPPYRFLRESAAHLLEMSWVQFLRGLKTRMAQHPKLQLEPPINISKLRLRVLGLCLRKKLFHEDIRGVFGFQSSSWPAHYKITQIAREEVSSEVRLMQALLPTTMSKHLGVGFASQPPYRFLRESAAHLLEMSWVQFLRGLKTRMAQHPKLQLEPPINISKLRLRVLGLCLRKKLFHEDIRGVFGFQSSSWPAHYKITQIAREEVSSEVRLMQALLPTTMSKHLGVGFASQPPYRFLRESAAHLLEMSWVQFLRGLKTRMAQHPKLQLEPPINISKLRLRVLGLCLRKKLFHEDIRGVFGFQSSSWPAHYKITQIAREEVSSEVRLMQALLPTTMSKHLGVGFASQPPYRFLRESAAHLLEMSWVQFLRGLKTRMAQHPKLQLEPPINISKLRLRVLGLCLRKKLFHEDIRGVFGFQSSSWPAHYKITQIAREEVSSEVRLMQALLPTTMSKHLGVGFASQPPYRFLRESAAHLLEMSWVQFLRGLKTRMAQHPKLQLEPPINISKASVYSIPLGCGAQYIGQTGRCLNDRLREHANEVQQAASNPSLHSLHPIAQHVGSCPSCEPEFPATTTVGTHRSRYGREIIEAFAMRHSPQNIGSPSLCLSDADVSFLRPELRQT
ncbi:uncharacterized protein ISCGN_007455 [Ixodes scapularis]